MEATKIFLIRLDFDIQLQFHEIFHNIFSWVNFTIFHCINFTIFFRFFTALISRDFFFTVTKSHNTGYTQKSSAYHILLFFSVLTNIVQDLGSFWPSQAVWCAVHRKGCTGTVLSAVLV